MAGNYDSLKKVLGRAYIRASEGKGKERHADGKPFNQQPIVTELHAFKTPAPALFQVRKKALESMRLSADRAQDELLDVIVYAAAAWLYIEESKSKIETPTD